jgi:hypothetical protein
MTDGPMSGKLPVEHAEPTPQPVVIAHLASNTAEAYQQVAEAARIFEEFARKLTEIVTRMEPVLREIGEISDGAGDDDSGAAAG